MALLIKLPSFCLFVIPILRHFLNITSSEQDKLDNVSFNLITSLISTLLDEICLPSLVINVFLEFACTMHPYKRAFGSPLT